MSPLVRRGLERARAAPAGQHVVLAALAHLVALGAAWLVARAIPAGTASLEEARRLGIVSLTTLHDHDKARETAVFVACELVAVLGTIGLWLGAWCALAMRGGPGASEAATRRALAREPARARRPLVSPAIVDWLLVPLVVVYATVDVHRLQALFEGRWGFLAEEGLILSPLERLLRGGVLYRDEQVMYGPLLFWPLAGFLSLTGPSVLALRVAFLALDVVGFIALYHVLRVATGGRGRALLGLAFFLASFTIFPSDVGAIFRPSVQESVLRFALSTAWIPLALGAGRAGTGRLLACGLVLGGAVGLSPELGAVAHAAFGAAALLDWLRGPARSFARVRSLALVALGSALVVGTVAAVAASQGALGAMLRTWGEKSRLTALGHSNVPFPPLGSIPDALAGRDVVVFGPPQRPHDVLLAWWAPWIASVGAIVVGIRLLLARLERADVVTAALVVATGLSFRPALARPDATHAAMALVPGVALALALLRRAASGVRSGEFRVVSLASALVVAATLGSLRFVLPPVATLEEVVRRNVLQPTSKLVPGRAAGRRVAVARAAGILVPEPFASELESLAVFVATHTRPDESVFAFPHDAAYYFYFDRPNPTPFGTCHMAITRADREALVASLEASRPRLVLVSALSGRPDRLDDAVMYPEITRYIREHYSEVARVGETHVLERNDAASR